MVSLFEFIPLKPSLIAIALTEPQSGSVLPEHERAFLLSELEDLIGPEKTKRLLRAAEAFHKSIDNLKPFQNVKLDHKGSDVMEEVHIPSHGK